MTTSRISVKIADASPANVTVVNVTSSCVRIKWAAVPLEQIGGIFKGYIVTYITDGYSLMLYEEYETNNFTHEAEICQLQSFTTYKFYVRRFLLNKMGNWSKVQYFTTAEQGT